MEYKYTEEDYERLQHYFEKASQVRYGSPDQFQFHQNELCRQIALFLLKPYEESRGQPSDSQEGPVLISSMAYPTLED